MKYALELLINMFLFFGAIIAAIGLFYTIIIIFKALRIGINELKKNNK